MTDPAILSTLGTEPIPGGKPAGDDIRLTDDYAAIQTEIDKLSAMTGPGPGVNWELVTDLGSKILSESSKDLTLAAYVGMAFQELGKAQVLAKVAAFLADILDNFWETLFPGLNRLRARKNALDWWRGRTIAWLNKPQDPIPGADYEEIENSLNRLDISQGKYDLVPLGELISLARQLPVIAAPARNPAGSGPSGPAGAEASPVAAADGGGPAMPPPKDVNEAKVALLAQARTYLGLAGDGLWADPWYWKVSRLSMWFSIKAPPTSEGTMTQLPAPPGDILSNLKKMMEAGNVKQALAFSEEQLKTHIFFLNLQEASHEALISLGFVDSAKAIHDEASFFVARFPLLLTLTFDDGTPLASEETKQWLKSSPPGQASGAAAVTALEERVRNATQGNPAQGLSNLSKPENRPRD
ncbi:MAG: type VI secretion system domain-containing protein, partial [Deltaproteobacteria bacterium]|nr:type VI secretion system domain-containing protein [Deltaproteobacteria bacterium]